MTDLAAFLAARLDDDAVSATMREIHTHECESTPPVGGGYTFPCDCGVPERMLREVAAKRGIVAQYQAAIDGVQEWGITSTLEEAVQRLAAVYSDHPDYDPAWRPG